MFMLMDHCLSRVRAHEVLQEPRPVMSQETLTRATPAYRINTSPRLLALSDVVNLGIHLCSAVQYLHRHNVLHLDLKSSNVVSERQLAKVIDLSIARSPARDRKGARTPQYMAPEQARGGYLSPATDVWGIGAVLFEATTGEEPFNADDEDDEPSYVQTERRISPIAPARSGTLR
jgi:eukaryotic-like serine/threonine-protein kinase